MTCWQSLAQARQCHVAGLFEGVTAQMMAVIGACGGDELSVKQSRKCAESDGSDEGFSAVKRTPRPQRAYGHHSGRRAPHEQALTVWCETDIFRAIGLTYVPPFMRFFHDVKL